MEFASIQMLDAPRSSPLVGLLVDVGGHVLQRAGHPTTSGCHMHDQYEYEAYLRYMIAEL